MNSSCPPGHSSSSWQQERRFDKHQSACNMFRVSSNVIAALPIRRATKKLVPPSLAHRPRWSEDFAGDGLGLRYAVDSVSKGRVIAVGESERRGANIDTDHAHGIERYRIERRTRGAE